MKILLILFKIFIPVKILKKIDILILKISSFTLHPPIVSLFSAVFQAFY